ncbi:N-acylneuraminate cytidylyltransferase [Nocardioides lianchengensis]|uniref:N-acylneuraminate cytidylyltransferase n=1 Tax=Nocardioides lianchengensis TaxID=1045774 RepID=A0A1G6I1I1_9ACTN|nr:N-acylneuraminate cytidylyltransferase [Nocardioides lianchengensis]
MCLDDAVRNVAVIPARGGSQRIPRKNIRPFAGRPVLAYAVDAALDSQLFDDVVVTTDDEEIAAVARSLGARTPFLRPGEIADAVTPMVDVVLHAVDELERAGSSYDHVCTLFATAPFIRAADLVAGLEVLAQGHPGAVSVTEFDFPVHRAFGLAEDGALRVLWPEHAGTRSQDLPEALHDAGQFYWTPVPVLRATRSLWPAGMRPVRLPRHRVQDIDTPADWTRAELMYAALVAGGEQP